MNHSLDNEQEVNPSENNEVSGDIENLEQVLSEDAIQESLADRVEDLTKQIEEQKDKYLRLFAEFDNYKKRTIKENYELRITAAKETIQAMLPILDDFQRAKKASESGSENEKFSEGVSLVYQKLFNTLESKGLKQIESNGQPFDIAYHEAITEIPAPTEDLKGKVIDTIESGYALNDKIIRYAKVVVGK
jgi:molecular chaperone GrpE